MKQTNLIDMKAAAKFFAVGLSTFKMRYKKWGVPHYWVGGSVRFSPHELYSWLKNRDHQDNNEGENETIG